MPTLNLGVLAHVDAGKTTLTERLLHAAGVIPELGRVDEGTTRTDTLALERRRGITIRSAVVSFPIGATSVNLVDTPGHPDFVAEVDRVLGVLDGAVLVVSAVEGVQPQTRVLMRALRRLRVPTLLFVNKVDRRGADADGVTAALRRRLRVPVVPLTRVRGAGTPAASVVPLDDGFAPAALDVLAAADDGLLAAFVADGRVPPERLRRALAEQTAAARVHPVLAGSAATGAGIELLRSALVELLPAAPAGGAGPPSGSVFKIERDAAGGKVAYARLFAGTVRLRDRPVHPTTRSPRSRSSPAGPGRGAPPPGPGRSPVSGAWRTPGSATRSAGRPRRRRRSSPHPAWRPWSSRCTPPTAPPCGRRCAGSPSRTP